MNSDDLINIMMNQINKGYFNRETLRYHSGERRRCFRLVMAHYFTGSFLNNETEFKWAQYYAGLFYFSARTKQYDMITNETLEVIKTRTIDFLCNKSKFNFLTRNKSGEILINDTKLNMYIDFLNLYSKRERTLFLYSDLKEFWDINALFKNIKILPHHWIELCEFRYDFPIHTFPEFFAYQDVVNLWNETIEKYEHLEELINSHIDSRAPVFRKVDYAFSTLIRTTLTAGVHYFETYLYYVYYNLKSSNKFSQNKVIKRNDIRKITDKEILKKLLYVEYPNLVETTSNYYISYEKTLEYRDAFVHMSAFEENGKSRMQYLIGMDLERLISSLTNIFEFMDLIESALGEDRILFWEKGFEKPNFLQKKVLMNIVTK